jgi:ABC-2 type transport system ATP-binding protein
MGTSDDAAALAAAAPLAAVKAAAHDGGGLVVHAAQAEMDAYVLALAGAAVAVRGLELDRTPLEALFFQLTGGPAAEVTP